MSARPDTAMVLAAGLGTRMRPLTDNTPKPLIKVAGKALIDYALDRFAGAGVKKAVVNVHYRAGQVEQHLRARHAPQIVISDERAQLLETGGGLKKARKHFSDAPIYCTNTDAILLDDGEAEACARLADHWSNEMDALLLLTNRQNASGYCGKGDFVCADDGRLSFRQGDEAQYIFTGLQLISPALIDEGPEGAFSTKILWERARARARLFGLVHQGAWMHVGDERGLAAAEARLTAPHRVS